jgi:hypothetical protein
VLGNWVKTFHPRNFGVNEFVKVFRLFLHDSLTPDVMGNNRRISAGSQVYALFQDSRNMSNAGIMARKTLEIVTDSGNSDDGNFGNLRGVGKLHFRPAASNKNRETLLWD